MEGLSRLSQFEHGGLSVFAKSMRCRITVSGGGRRQLSFKAVLDLKHYNNNVMFHVHDVNK